MDRLKTEMNIQLVSKILLKDQAHQLIKNEFRQIFFMNNGDIFISLL